MPFCPYCGGEAHRTYAAYPVGYECGTCQRSFDVGAGRQIDLRQFASRPGVSDDARFLVDAASIWALFSDRPFLGLAMRWMAEPRRIARDLCTFLYLILAMTAAGVVLAAMSAGLITARMVGVGLGGLIVLVVTLWIFRRAGRPRPARIQSSRGSSRANLPRRR